jgi:DNA polymerase I-like protein with 3'-5' exonuclease and polymerase domains
MDITLCRFGCPFTAWRPRDGRIFDAFAYDTETTDINDDQPQLTPCYVLGAACDGRRGVFVSRDSLLPFFRAHQGARFICHNAAFDLRVSAVLLQPHLDIYQAVQDNQVWDTQVLKRLHSLATAGHTARGESGLGACASTHLGVTLQKGQVDADGKTVRTSFGQFLGKPPSAIPPKYLAYLAHDALATWHLFAELQRLIKNVLRNSRGVFGYVNDVWLRDAIDRFGPLTHHVQLKASIIMDVLRVNGIGIDQTRCEEKARQVRVVRDDAKERLRRRGYQAGEGSTRALQSILNQFHREHPDVEMRRTESGKQWSTTEEDLAELAAEDEFFADLIKYRQAEKLLTTYLRKMGPARLHAKFGYLLETGRTYCGGGFNLQCLPREKDLLQEDPDAATVRGCFVPGDGKVFIDSDFSQIELVVLAYALQQQLGLRSVLADLVNSGRDVHRLIAATMLDKEPQEVAGEERNSVKPVSFGRPGGMGAERIGRVAKANYGIDLTTEQVEERIAAYHRLCPELDHFLDDEVDGGLVLARTLNLTPASYRAAIGQSYFPRDPDIHRPQGWLGGMLLKVLRDEQPTTRDGRPYTPDEIGFFWEAARGLPCKLKPEQQAKLQDRQADRQLWNAVRNWAGRRPVFTVTGRLRAKATFCSSRNNLFQGAAADGAVLALWRVWRAGYKLVDFIHDQLVVEAPADDRVHERVADIEGLMKEGMAQVVPGILVKVETVVTRSLSKKDLDRRYATPKEGDRRPATASAV